MLRTHTCGALRSLHIHQQVTLCGWVQCLRNKGSILWIDLRDRYGITQLIVEESKATKETITQARLLHREYVVQVTGIVIERLAKNQHIPTGEIEVEVAKLTILNKSKLPPFLIEEVTDGHETLRMQYRYLDLRRAPLQRNIHLAHQLKQHIRQHLCQQQFLEIDTPLLTKSTPEGARDFIVPARLQKGQAYALPQSPQTIKQLLMTAGFDRYMQFAKCFRDEDLRADRQPEFMQVDCELSFVTQEDILTIFEQLIQSLFHTVHNLVLPTFPRITYQKAMELYGTDKPDLRLAMPFVALSSLTQGYGCQFFDEATFIAGICLTGCANYTRKQLDELTRWIKTPPNNGILVYVKYLTEDTIRSSVDKFFTKQQLRAWLAEAKAQPGDLLLIIAGKHFLDTRKTLAALRHKIGQERDLLHSNIFMPLWVVDFPLVEWCSETGRYHAMHHPFTAPQEQDLHLLKNNPKQVKSQAYDLVINGHEIGGGSIRIHQRSVQEDVFKLLGMSIADIQQFEFLLTALEFGTPPHGGIALGLDRLCALMDNNESIRDYIAFPKNNAGRDHTLRAPAPIEKEQWKDLGITML